MTQSFLNALLGGALIGLSASAMLFFTGKVTGISGIMSALLSRVNAESTWKLVFLIGLLAGGFTLFYFYPNTIHTNTNKPLLFLVIAGLLVGFGTRLGSGCTSGHGVCGLTRFSPRSLVATLTFMGTGFVSATLLGLFGGAS